MKVVVVTEVVGDLVVARKFRAFGDRALMAEPAFEAIGEMMRAAEDQLFATSGSSGGDPWQPLSPETVRTKAQKGYPADIEIATEELRDSLVDLSSESHIEEIGPEFLLFGTSDEAAGYQQFGTPARHDMPARKILQFSDDQMEAFSFALYTYITKGVVDTSMFTS